MIKRMKKLIFLSTLMLTTVLGRTQMMTTDLRYFIGEGTDTAVLVVDFLDGTADSSYAWGYLFDVADEITAADMLADIAADESFLEIDLTAGFLNDIVYNGHEGLAGEPNYWGTWSKTADSEWITNPGISTPLENGDWFGCSYTDFDPAITPGVPLAAYESSRFTKNEVRFWIGEGPDSAVFVIDFVDDLAGEAVTYAWGYAFDESTSGAEMLSDLAASDVNLETDAGVFLNDILFNGLFGLAADPYYWSTWSGTNLSDWTLNAGLSTEVLDGDWFGCSYDEWPSRRPYYPIPAIDSAAFVLDDVAYELGEGTNRTVIVFDFNGAEENESFAVGYRFSTDFVVASEVLAAIDASELYDCTIDLTSGFLNDILFDGYEGIAGAPYYWATWSAKNVSGWELNLGITEELSNGDWFGCTYTNWSPATPPSLPENAATKLSLIDEAAQLTRLFPNPSLTGKFSIEIYADANIEILNANGQIVFNSFLNSGINHVDLSNLPDGVYFVQSENEAISSVQKLIIH
jgi:hypothetical protein